ncbi:unnamed protein product, partial [Sphacelaria rigidula]
MRQTGGTLLFACGLVHLDPSWINLLLRELLDHRLAGIEQTEQWRREVDEYCRASTLHFDDLVDTHQRYLKTGRLSKDYVRFLWRDVKDVDETALGRMMDTMSTYGAMFPCGPKGEENTEFVVPARLPYVVADGTLSDLEKAISSGVRMQFIFEILAKYVPPGIIAQFVGSFCRGRNIVFRACWNKGASFKMDGLEHLICLHEPTDHRPTRIEITVAGREEPTIWNPAFRAKDALTHLLQDQYRGLRFFPPGEPNTRGGNDAWQDTLGDLQEHLQSRIHKNLEDVLDKMIPAWQPPETSLGESESVLLNLINASLVRRLHELRLDVERDAHQQLETKFDELRLNIEGDADQRLQTKLDALSTSMGAKINGLKMDGLGDSSMAMLRNVAFDIACLRWPVPRLACLLPAHEGVLLESDRSYQSWNARLQSWFLDGMVVSKGVFRRDLRLFLLCAHDKSLVDCGPGGQGYEVKELLDWVRKAKPVAKVGLVLGSIALKACTGLAVPAEIDSAFGQTLGGVVSEIVKEGVGTAVEEAKSRALESLSDADDTEQPSQLEPVRKANPLPVDGFVYEQLTDTIRGFERAGYKTKKGAPAFHSFRREMQLVDR